MINLFKTTTFSINTYEEVTEAAKTGTISFYVKVRGFWSNETITGQIRRVRTSTNTFEWKPTISVSTDGRDINEVPSDLAAYDYYSQALNGLVAYMTDIEVDFEHIYQSHRNEPTMTEKQAIELLDTITENHSNVHAVVAALGGAQLQDNFVSWDQHTVKAMKRSNVFVYAFKHNKVSRKVMLQELMKLSGRFRIVTETNGI
jgi:hypothetical protein